MDDPRRCVALLGKRRRARIGRDRVEERRVRARKCGQVEGSGGVCVAEGRRSSRLPEEPDRRPGRRVRPRSWFRVEACRREQLRQIGQELQVAQRARFFVDGELSRRPVRRHSGAFDQGHARKQPAGYAERPRREVGQGGVDQLVPEDRLRYRRVVHVDLSQPRLGEAGLRRADEEPLLVWRAVEEHVHRRGVARERGEFAYRAPRYLCLSREQEALVLGLLAGKVQHHVLGPDQAAERRIQARFARLPMEALRLRGEEQGRASAHDQQRRSHAPLRRRPGEERDPRAGARVQERKSQRARVGRIASS